MAMNVKILISIIAAFISFCAVIISYLAFNRNKSQDTSKEATELTTIRLNGEYTKSNVEKIEKGVQRIENRLAESEMNQIKINDKIAHLDERVSKLESEYSSHK